MKPTDAVDTTSDIVPRYVGKAQGIKPPNVRQCSDILNHYEKVDC